MFALRWLTCSRHTARLVLLWRGSKCEQNSKNKWNDGKLIDVDWQRFLAFALSARLWTHPSLSIPIYILCATSDRCLSHFNNPKYGHRSDCIVFVRDALTLHLVMGRRVCVCIYKQPENRFIHTMREQNKERKRDSEKSQMTKSIICYSSCTPNRRDEIKMDDFGNRTVMSAVASTSIASSANVSRPYCEWNRRGCVLPCGSHSRQANFVIARIVTGPHIVWPDSENALCQRWRAAAFATFCTLLQFI